MKKQTHWVLRSLALAHFVWGMLLVAGAALFAISALRVLPHMSTGSIRTNLSGTLLFAATNCLPLVALGVWMFALGRWLGAGHSRLRIALLGTHAVSLVVGVIAVVVGVYSLGAAERSAAAGGGLLSPVAIIPLLYGVPATALALCSIAAALRLVPRLEVNS